MRLSGPGFAALLGVAALSAVALYFVFELDAGGGPGLPLDDGWIHLQFARNVAQGEGLSYRGGELVGGSTAPLWTALLSLVFLLPLPPVLGAKILATLCFVGAALALVALGRELGLGEGASLLAGLLFVATDWMVWSALSGMEIALFVLLSVLGMWSQIRERRRTGALPLALPLFALCALARPEGLLLLLLGVVDQALRPTVGAAGWRLQRPAVRPLVQGLLSASLLLLPVALFLVALHGSPFPTTLAVKTEGVRSLLPSGRHLHVLMGILFRPQPWMFLFAGAGVVTLVGRWGGKRDAGLLPALWLLLLPVAYSTLSPPQGPVVAGNFGRYLFPLFPPLILLGLLGVEDVARRFSRLELGRSRLPLLWLFVSLALAPSLSTLLSGAGRYGLNVRNVEQSDVAMAVWVSGNLPADALLGVQDVGAMGYFTPNPMVDLAGITTPEILPYIKGDRVGSHPTGLGGLMEYVRDAGVDYLILFPRSYGGLETLQSVEPGLRPIYGLEIERNITMAGSELVVLETPW